VPLVSITAVDTKDIGVTELLDKLYAPVPTLLIPATLNIVETAERALIVALVDVEALWLQDVHDDPLLVEYWIE